MLTEIISRTATAQRDTAAVPANDPGLAAPRSAASPSVERLRGAGHEPTTEIVDEAFGRSFTIRDPEGLLIQINENDYELPG